MSDDPARRRLRVAVTGAVQGVGFRPFVLRLAASEGLGGQVCNTASGAEFEIEGPPVTIDRFLARLPAELPPPGRIHGQVVEKVPASGQREFSIATSRQDGPGSALVLPDLATCAACLAEILDPRDRRHRYPFTTCTACGPRYSIIEAVPWDRARTTMRDFAMCGTCAAEYADPDSRRFHAETNACAACGPLLALCDSAGRFQAAGDGALLGAAEALREGAIVALKGLGGYQLLVDARSEPAVRRLRARKARPAKPFAVMVAGPAEARTLAEFDDDEAALLASPAAPIVLLRARRDVARIAVSVAPGNPLLGIMLPATPLHHLLLRDLGFAVVATSGNRGAAPIVSANDEAFPALGGIADFLLNHDRNIRRPVDDSVVRMIAGQPTTLRCARGYAPLLLAEPRATVPVLALGGQQKAAVALAGGGRVLLGPHVGELDDADTRTRFAGSIETMQALFDLPPALVACDTHPDYHTTHVADRLGSPVRPVPHHLAHVRACMLDNEIDGPVLGIAWDGTGHGGDGTIWGGECLAVDRAGWHRAAHLLPFRLPGGAAAIREPRRAALGVLHAAFGPAGLERSELDPVASFRPADRSVLAAMVEHGINAPVTSSMGRLFDAVASCLGLCQVARFEGEAAMAVEFAAEQSSGGVALPPFALVERDGILVLDWRALLAGLVEGRCAGRAVADLAAGFHAALAGLVVAVAERIGIRRVLLTGGCFQNARLTALALDRLDAAGFEAYRHRRIPPNDGGLAAGQAAAAGWPVEGERR